MKRKKVEKISLNTRNGKEIQNENNLKIGTSNFINCTWIVKRLIALVPTLLDPTFSSFLIWFIKTSSDVVNGKHKEKQKPIRNVLIGTTIRFMRDTFI